MPNSNRSSPISSRLAGRQPVRCSVFSLIVVRSERISKESSSKPGTRAVRLAAGRLDHAAGCPGAHPAAQAPLSAEKAVSAAAMLLVQDQATQCQACS